LFNDLPVCCSRVYGIDDDAVAPSDGQSGSLCQRGIHALGHLRRISFRTKAFEEWNTGQALPRLVAAQNDRARHGADERCETESQRRLARTRETLDRDEVGAPLRK
jgi:hypothetical protein